MCALIEAAEESRKTPHRRLSAHTPRLSAPGPAARTRAGPPAMKLLAALVAALALAAVASAASVEAQVQLNENTEFIQDLFAELQRIQSAEASSSDTASAKRRLLDGGVRLCRASCSHPWRPPDPASYPSWCAMLMHLSV